MKEWALQTTRPAAPDTRIERPFAVSPFTNRCADILDRGQHIVFGVSPGNGYFSEQRLIAMLQWADERFERIDVVTSHIEMAACTYLGRGYEPKRAKDRAYRDVRQMANRIKRAVQGAMVEPGKCRVLYISDGFDTQPYRDARHAITRAKQESSEFANVCTRMVADALRGQLPSDWQPTAEQISAGTKYLEMELPYFIDSPGILGTPESLFAYRVIPAFAPFLYMPGAPLPAVDGQGFVKLEPHP